MPNTDPVAKEQLAQASKPVHIIDGKHEPHRIYHVIQDDDGIVLQTAREVALGSKLVSNQNLWVANFHATVLQVRDWCNDRTEQVRAALVDIRSNKVLFYFVPDSTRYDVNLGAAMTQLEVSLGGSAGIGYVESLQVPARSLRRFVGAKSLIVWQRQGDDLFAEPEGLQQDHD